MRPELIVLSALLEGQDVEHKGTLIRLDGGQLYWRSNLTRTWSRYNMTVADLIRVSNQMSVSELRYLTKSQTASRSALALKKHGIAKRALLRLKKSWRKLLTKG